MGFQMRIVKAISMDVGYVVRNIKNLIPSENMPKKHQLVVSPGENEFSHCKICNKVYMNTANLQKHIRDKEDTAPQARKIIYKGTQ